MLHRLIEAPQTERALRKLFAAEKHFHVHAALEPHDALSDEGAANHSRMCASVGEPGVEVFIYGRRGGDVRPGFPARQSLEASQAIARRHGLAPERTVFGLQAAKAIDAGAFHNDVVAVAHEHVLFHHEHAFEDKAALFEDIRAKAKGLFEPIFVEVPDARVSLADAISSYLFNSQLVHLPGDRTLTLITPTETRENNKTASFVAEMIAAPNAPIGRVEYVEVRESMRNGGGPACLRLRVVMTQEERAAASQGFFLTDDLAVELEAWITQHYREEIAPADLADLTLIDETQWALDALTRILPLGSDFYDFQRA
jgi:succinylarginine dihydrolase